MTPPHGALNGREVVIDGVRYYAQAEWDKGWNVALYDSEYNLVKNHQEGFESREAAIEALWLI